MDGDGDGRKLTPDVIALPRRRSHVLMTEEPLQVDVAALILARIPVNTRGGSRGLVAVDVESADLVLARPGIDLELPQTGHGLGGSGAGEDRDGSQEGGRLHVDGEEVKEERRGGG